VLELVNDDRDDQGRRSHRIIGKEDIKEDWGSSPPAGSRGGAPVGGLGTSSPEA